VSDFVTGIYFITQEIAHKDKLRLVSRSTNVSGKCGIAGSGIQARSHAWFRKII